MQMANQSAARAGVLLATALDVPKVPQSGCAGFSSLSSLSAPEQVSGKHATGADWAMLALSAALLAALCQVGWKVAKGGASQCGRQIIDITKL
jgi:hypothetical protein